MEKLILVVHILTALSIIGLILLQQGKGAEMGASFGAGASQTVFGSRGSGNFFTRATAVLATLFFATSFGLAIVAKKGAGVQDADIPTVIESREVPAEVESDVPRVDDTDEETLESDVPVVDNAAQEEPLREEPASDVPAVKEEQPK